MISYSEEEARVLAKEVSSKLKGGEVVFLEGDLGSGKTTFVRAVVEAMGYTEPVRSPTFTIMNRYPVEWNGIKQVLHLDLYRLEHADELEPLALEEEMGLKDSVIFIEWPKLLAERGVKPTQTIQFQFTEEQGFQIEVN